MWCLEQSPRLHADDVGRFLAVVNQHVAFFASAAPIHLARAPGRLDVMGGIADYSGSLVLELPLAVATFVAVQAASDEQIEVLSTAAEELNLEQRISLPVAALAPRKGPLDIGSARRLLGADPRRAWAAYVLGLVVIMQRKRRIRPAGGLRILVHSDVPVGAGVSSSAALEVAALGALAAAHNVKLDGREAALLCQQVENQIVGAPCGAMDQITTQCGRQGHLLALLCQPAELQPSVPVPPEIGFWGIDSGIRHSVAGSEYRDVRVGAFMGYRILAELAGLAVTPRVDGRVQIDDPRWHGYLANVSPMAWHSEYRHAVPESLEGETFLRRYGGTTDTATCVDPSRTYAVRASTGHPICEHQRVESFCDLLQTRPQSDEDLSRLGGLMYASHTSYSDCGMGSTGTDRLVNLVRLAGNGAGLFGARITGGGCGGTVAVLGRKGAGGAVRDIAAAYARETGQDATVFSGSSAGAEHFGVLRLFPEPRV